MGELVEGKNVAATTHTYGVQFLDISKAKEEILIISSKIFKNITLN